MSEATGLPPIWTRLLASLRSRPVLANSAALIVLRAANLVVRLGLLFLLARLVTPAEFGYIAVAMSVAEIGKVVADFGTDTFAIREFAQGEAGSHRRFASTLAGVKLTATFLVMATFALWSLRQGASVPHGVALLALGSVFTAQLVNFPLDYFQGRMQAHLAVLPVVASNALLGCAAAIALPHMPTLEARIALLPMVELGAGCALLAALRARGELPGVRATLAGGGRLLRGSLPIAATAIVIMTYSRLDMLMLSGRVSAEQIGWYGMAFRLTEPFQIAAAAFGMSVFGRFSAAFVQPGSVELLSMARRYVAGTLVYGLAVAILLWLFAPPVITRVLPGYAGAIPILRVLAMALIFRTLNATLAGIIQGAGRFAWLTGLAVCNLALVFALLRVLVPDFGARGAALALLCAEGVNMLIQFVLVLHLTRRSRGGVAHAA